MKFAAAAVILVLSAPVAAAGPKTKVAAKSRATKPAATAPAASPAPSPEPAFGASRLRHETIGIGPGYGSIEAGQAELARKDDDVALTRSLTARGAAPQAGPFAAVEAAVAKKKPTATGRVRVSFDVDRRGKVQRAIVVGFDRGVDKAIEAQLAAIVLPREYAGQHVDTVLAFRQGKLLRR
jgi:hypothetical protein